MHHCPLLRAQHLRRVLHRLHRAMQQIRRMGEGVFEAQVVVQNEMGRIRGAGFEVVVDGAAIEQGVFAEEPGWIGVTLTMV